MSHGGAEHDRLQRTGGYVGQSQWRHDVFAQARVVRLAAQHFDETAEHAVPGVVVGELLTRVEQLRHIAQTGDVLLQSVVTRAGIGEDVPFEASGVGQQLAHRDLR
jgi:hypothetical protein